MYIQYAENLLTAVAAAAAVLMIPTKGLRQYAEWRKNKREKKPMRLYTFKKKNAKRIEKALMEQKSPEITFGYK